MLTFLLGLTRKIKNEHIRWTAQVGRFSGKVKGDLDNLGMCRAGRIRKMLRMEQKSS